MLRQLLAKELPRGRSRTFKENTAHVYMIYVSFPTLELNPHLKAATPLFLHYDPFLSVCHWRNLTDSQWLLTWECKRIETLLFALTLYIISIVLLIAFVFKKN